MKQLLFIALIFFAALKSPHAQETISPDDLSWGIIRSSFFGENYSKAFRYEKDIRIKLDGTPTKRDSQIVLDLITELKPLLETVTIDLVNENANFEIEFIFSELSMPKIHHTTWRYKGSEIEYSRIFFTVPSATSVDSAKTFIRYFIIKHLTRRFSNNPVASYTKDGILSQRPNSMNVTSFNFVDKDILQKLYSRNFYKDLRKNTVEKKGYLVYLKLRYENILNNFLLALAVVTVILVFLHLVSRHKRNEQKSLYLFFKRNQIVFLTIALIVIIHESYTQITVLGPDFPSWRNFVLAFILIWMFSILTGTIIFMSERLILNPSQNFWKQQAFIFINTFVAISIAFGLFSLIPLLVSHENIYDNVPQQLLANTPLLFLVVLLAFLRVLFNVVTFYVQNKIDQKDVEIAKMKELKNQAELNALHSRINPHFLYNSLNSIASLAHIDADRTESMATGLSELFRYSINKENKTYVSIAEELEMVTKYLEIEKTRFGSKLEYEINADESTQEKQIPKFLIQPLVENAVKHGLSKIKESGKIVVEVKRLEKALSISIYDNGPDFPKEPVSGYGLQNLHDKLAIIYGDDAVINWENGANKNFNMLLKNQF